MVAVEVVVVVVSVGVPLVHAPPFFRRQFTSFTSSTTIEALTVVDMSRVTVMTPSKQRTSVDFVIVDDKKFERIDGMDGIHR